MYFVVVCYTFQIMNLCCFCKPKKKVFVIPQLSLTGSIFFHVFLVVRLIVLCKWVQHNFIRLCGYFKSCTFFICVLWFWCYFDDGMIEKLYCIVLYCIILYCIVLYCIALCCIVRYCIALHCIAMHCIALHCIENHTTVSFWFTSDDTFS